MGARKTLEEGIHVSVARAALLAAHVDLEVRIGPRHRLQPLARQRREQGAAEVGVEHHARSIDDAREGEHPALREARHHALGQCLDRGRRGGAFNHEPALGGKHFSRGVGEAAARDAGERGMSRHAGDEGVHPRQRAQERRCLILPRQARSPRARAPGR